MAVTVSGCGVDKAGESGRQLDVIGDVQISTTLCTSGDVDQDSRACGTYSQAHRGQVLVAYRIPSGSEAPDAFGDDGGTLQFSRSDSYSGWMENAYPEPGMHWAGYDSQARTVGAGRQAAVTVSPQLTLPEAGKPFAGPYRYRVVAGYRELASPAEDGSAPVACGGDPTTFCFATGEPTAGEDSAQPTRDLAVLPTPGEPVVAPGGAVSVPFDLAMSGAGGGTFALDASTDLPGAQVDLGRQTLEPGAGSSSRVAPVVSVPAGAADGVYSVKLTAAVTGDPDVIIRKVRVAARIVGETELRSGTMTFRVVSAPHEDPPAHDEAQPRPDVTPAAVSYAAPQAAAPPGAQRARLRLSLSALPRRAYSGGSVSYLVIARNTSSEPAIRTRVCEALPRTVQFVAASRRLFFRGQSVCFHPGRLAGGSSAVALVYVHVDTDAPAGMWRAWGSAVAANADRARARADLRVMRRAAAPRPAPVTG